MMWNSTRLAALVLVVFGGAVSARAAESAAAGPAAAPQADAGAVQGSLALSLPAVPQQTAQAGSGPSSTGQVPADSRNSNDTSGYFGNWFARVDAAQASQPHWMTPLATVTPRLEEEYRYDQFYQHTGTGATIDNFGGGKGLELIPTETNEIILGVPPYEQRSNTKAAAQGLGDDPVLLIKQRLLSANEESGNYIVTAFLGFQ